MTVMGKENLMIPKKRSCRINFKVALDFIFKFTYFLKPHSELSVSISFLSHLYLNEAQELALVPSDHVLALFETVFCKIFSIGSQID